MAREWFFLVLLNSSSFSAILLSISWRTCPSSSWALSTLFSSPGSDGKRCIDKVEMVEETEYDDVVQCDHSYD